VAGNRTLRWRLFGPRLPTTRSRTRIGWMPPSIDPRLHRRHSRLLSGFARAEWHPRVVAGMSSLLAYLLPNPEHSTAARSPGADQDQAL